MSRDYPINPIGLTVSDRDFHRWLSKGAAAFREDESDPSTLNAEGVTSGLQDFVMDLTLEDLRTPARPWRGDFLDSGQGFWSSFALPKTEEELESRLQTNLGTYLGNYVAILCIISVCIMFKKPLALLSMVGLVKLWDLFLKYKRRPDTNIYGTWYKVLSWALQIFSAVLLIFCQAALALMAAALLSGAVILAHAACRKPPDPFWVDAPPVPRHRSQSVVGPAEGRRRPITRRATTGSL